MKRLISVLLCICMLFSTVASTGLSFAFAAGEFDGTDYADLFNSSSSAYSNTFVINPSWDLTTATNGTTSLTYTFRNVTVTETYNSARHFSSFAAAKSAWDARHASGTGYAKTLATSVPNFVLAAGTYSEQIKINFSANIYGAQAGITPNDPSFVPSKALPTATWAANSARNGSTNETVLSGGIYRTNMYADSATDLTYENVLDAAGVTSYTVNIDGVKLTSAKAFAQKDLAYDVGGKRTVTVNVKNTILSGNEYGFSAAGDPSRNYLDYNLSDVRITGLTNRLFHCYIRKVDITRMCFADSTGRFWYPSNSSGNDLWWTSTGGSGVDRYLDIDIKDSAFTNLTTNYIFYLSDNSYLEGFTFDITGSLFSKVSGNYGIFCIYSYSGNGYPTPKITMTNNTFYSATLQTSLFNGNENYQKAPINYTLNNNRIIGYKGEFQNTKKTMDAILSGCVWNYDNNYCADTFTGASDALGTAPGYGTSDATVHPVDIDTVPYYVDYNMTHLSTEAKVTGAQFASSVNSVVVSEDDKKVFVTVKDGMSVSNPTFTFSSANVTGTLYDNATNKNKVSTISYAALGSNDSVDYYLEVKFKDVNWSTGYTVTVQKWTNLPSFANDYNNATVNNAALLLPDNSYSTGAFVGAEWDGTNYQFVVGVDAFASVAEAVKAGFTQVILSSSLNYNDVTVTDGVTLFGEDWESDPNTYTSDPIKAPTLTKAWNDGKETVINGQTTVAATVSGKEVVFKGIMFKGYFRDTARAVSAKKTAITLENCIYAFADTYVTGDSNKAIALNNANAKNKNAATANIDEFTIKNSRIAPIETNTSMRLFEELTPAKFTLDGVVFAENYFPLGWPKWQAGVSNGAYTIQNCFFGKNANASSSATGHFEGIASHCTTSGKTTKYIFKNNTVVDAVSTQYNQNKAAITLYAGAYTDIDISNNLFVDTNNLSSSVITFDTSKSTYAALTASVLERINFKNNRVIGMVPFVYNSTVTSGNMKNATGNYYARYTADYKTADAGERMLGYMSACDYYLDYDMTTLASEMEMVSTRDLSMVDTLNKNASIVIGKTENYSSDLYTKSGVKFLFYEDADCNISVANLNADYLGDGKLLYAKAVNENGVAVVYEVFVSVGNLDAKEPTTVGTANIASPYLYYVKTEEMPTGAKFVMNWQGTDYVFTKGTNAFASVSQITDYHSRNSSGTPNVILPAGVLNVDSVVTKTVNFYGESAQSIMTAEPDKSSAVKIACVGDSITEGHGIDVSLRPTSSYPAQLQTKLDAEYGEGAYEVGNFGWGGSTVNIMSNKELGNNWTYWTYIYTVQYYQSIDFNPDIVVIMMGHNDTHNVFYTTPETYKQRYQTLIDTYTALPSHPTVVIAGCTGRGASLRQDYLTQTIIPLQKELASENNLTYIDMYTPTINLVSDKSYFGDGLHGTVLGYDLISDLIMDGMSHLLTNTRSYTKSNITVDTSKRVAPEEKIKVACIGDSLTYGDKSYGGYPVYLQEMLGDGYEVRNFGECGSIACDESTLTGKNYCYKSYKRYTESKNFKPDIVVMMLGYNDQGGHLTSQHSGINWTGGASSTAAAEFKKDYKALVKEYVDLGATVYCVSAPSNYGATASGTVNAYINPIIKQTASDLGLVYYNIWADTNKWGADMYCGANSGLSGEVVTDNTHFSDKGYEALAGLIHKELFSDFSATYVDKYDEIDSSAVIVDYKASTHSTGDTVKYAWEGNTYNFKWGVNAFSNINDAINNANSKNITKLQVLIPENDVGTTKNHIFSIGTDISKITSIEVFGQNRRFDPNDKTLTASDPTADWTRNPNWDMYSTKGGTSGIDMIEIQCGDSTGGSILAGKLKFKGITMRNVFWSNQRKVGTASDPRNLDIIFENCLVDFNAVSTSGGYLFELTSGRTTSGNTTFATDDSLTLKNFRIERFLYKSGKNRLFCGYGPNNVTIDGMYYNEALNVLGTTKYPLGMMGWLHTPYGVPDADMKVINSNFRNGTVTFNIAPIFNGSAAHSTKTANVTFSNNVFFETCASTPAINLFSEFYTGKYILENNTFVQSTGTVDIIDTNGTSAGWCDFFKGTYSAKNNTFVVNTLSRFADIGMLKGSAVDLTGSYVSTYASNYVNATTGVNTTNIASNYTSSYWYVDFMRRVKNTEFVINKFAFEQDVESVEINNNNRTASILAQPGSTLNNLGVTAGNSLITATFYSDEAHTKKLDAIKLSVNEGTETYYLVLNYGTYSVSYTVNFTVGAVSEFKGNYVDPDGIVLDSAVALTDYAKGLATGSKIVTTWQGELYSFYVGTNAFASTTDIKTKFGAGSKLQVIIPAGTVSSDVYVYGSWSVYGEGYKTNPNIVNGDKWSYNTNWEKYGKSVVVNKNVVIAAEATPTSAQGTTIVVAGIEMTRYFNDENRKASNYKTDITLENIVYDRRYLTTVDSREFNFENANNKCTDTAYTNIDSFTIRNMYFKNTNSAAGNGMSKEAYAPFFTLDGLCIPEKAPSWGYPKVSKTSPKHVFTMTNCYIGGHSAETGRWNFFISFSGHVSSVDSASRDNYDTTLNITNNKFVDCGNEKSGLDTRRWVIELFPQSYKKVNVTGNDIISTTDGDYEFIRANTIEYTVNSGDYSDRFNVRNNRFIGVLPNIYMNEDTSVDLSENFFTEYTANYKTDKGDIPADADADYYLDYNMTTKLSDTRFALADVSRLTFDTSVFTAYGYSDESSVSLDGVKAYSDAACTKSISTLNVKVGEASKAYVKSGNIVYTLYVMGVRNVADLGNATVNPATVDGVSSPAVWYPTLYGAPNGMTVYTYYGDACYGFTTGKNVVTSAAVMSQYSNELLLPDNITSFALEAVVGVKLHSTMITKLGTVTNRTLRVAAVGDSITEGAKASNAATTAYPARLQNYFTNKGHAVEVKNFGRSAATVTTINDTMGYERQYKTWTDSVAKYNASIAYNPDVVVIGLGTNDLYGGRWQDNMDYAEQYIELIRDYQALGTKPAIYITTALYRWDNTMMNDRLMYNLHEMQEYVAKAVGAKVIDTYTSMRPYANDTYIADQLHPNDAGYELLAGFIGDAMSANINKYSSIGVTLAGGTLPTKTDIVSASLVVGETLDVNYYATLKSEHTSAQMRFTVNDKIYIVDGEATGVVGKYRFPFVNVPPQCMGDNIKAELILDGTVLDTEATYSVESYCRNTLENYPDNEKLRTLVADILAYGAAAQEYRGYKTDDLVNTDISGTSTFKPLTKTDKSITGTKTDGVGFKGVGVWFDSINSIYFTYYAPAGKDVKVTVNGESAYDVTDNGDGTFTAYTEGISALNFDDVYTIKIYDGDTLVQTLTYSVNSYIYSKQSSETIGELVRALYNYGESAKAYKNV